ncbi:rhodanese-like domain-containing protein [Kribbella sp. NPDC003505]|uniref:rhodanese-like domain-containing protein n=1 Tax=Kribbella sp. NPDC003505 TaxID=3154448 RepID=UPI0033B46FC2
MTRDELTKRLLAGDIVVLDIRPAPEYASGHLPGAVSLPIDQLRERLDEVLAGAGHAAYRLEDGFPEWSLAGLPIEHQRGW